MKRSAIILAVFSLCVGLVSIAAAPMASGTAYLTGVGYVEGKGVVFTFQVSGKFSRSDLNGSLHVNGGGNYGLDCVRADTETVKCTAVKAVAGHYVVVTWGGSTFWTYVPEIPSPQPQYCYSVYDWDLEDPATEWVNYGTYCQDTPAEYGDFIIWYNPGWGDEFPYEYLPESPDQDWCPFTQSGNGYYYPLCDPNSYEPGL